MIDEIRTILDRIERAWRHADAEGLEACFHPDAVIVGPSHQVYARGATACARSYLEFAAAEVDAYTESGHELRVYGDTAVYTFTWQMTYSRGHGPKTEAGTDVLVFARGEAGWQVVWRNLLVTPG